MTLTKQSIDVDVSAGHNQRSEGMTMNRLNDNEEQHAQHIACGHLVKGCEGAIIALAASAGTANERPRTRKRAQEILTQVLSSWRDAMSVVTPRQGLGNAETLDGWTTDELVAEALTRHAGDGPALRLMQGLTLQAQLTAHDDE